MNAAMFGIPYQKMNRQEIVDIGRRVGRAVTEKEAYSEIFIERTVSGAQREMDRTFRRAVIAALIVGAVVGGVAAWIFSAWQYGAGAI